MLKYTKEEKKMNGIYIHIPFCIKRCSYCDFCSSVPKAGAIESYTSALIKSIDNFPVGGVPSDTIYFGGGTPSLLSEVQFERILNAVVKKFDVRRGSEITAEANPGTVSEDYLSSLRKMGLNRISFGIQSCKEKELYTLGRIHSFSEACKAVELSKKAGIDNISADIMLGIPYQTKDSALESVRKIASLGVKHISAYMLKIEPGTRFDCEEIRSLIPDDDTVSDIYLEAVKALDRLGFKQYEISNFSVPGYESKHNLKYWTGEEYIGFGASAHSFFGGKRFYTDDNIEEFIKNPCAEPLTEDSEPDALEEYILLGLRLCKGISLDRIADLGGDISGIESLISRMIFGGLMIKSGDRIALTPEGFLVSNGIISSVIEKVTKI